MCVKVMLNLNMTSSSWKPSDTAEPQRKAELCGMCLCASSERAPSADVPRSLHNVFTFHYPSEDEVFKNDVSVYPEFTCINFSMKSNQNIKC